MIVKIGSFPQNYRGETKFYFLLELPPTPVFWRSPTIGLINLSFTGKHNGSLGPSTPQTIHFLKVEGPYNPNLGKRRNRNGEKFQIAMGNLPRNIYYDYDWKKHTNHTNRYEDIFLITFFWNIQFFWNIKGICQDSAISSSPMSSREWDQKMSSTKLVRIFMQKAQSFGRPFCWTFDILKVTSESVFPFDIHAYIGFASP